MPYSSLNTSYVSPKLRTKFPTGIVQHREIQRTVQITGERYRKSRDTKAKRSIACNPFDANLTIRRFPEADVDYWEFCAKYQRL